ncbi:AlpA family transcriptional regulator [Corynebacterium sp.]|uniref:helix-turn-helix transcriptional regulator n=1 Tax=Corynebacterium sp. TaxID=1720 RepID=UPI0027B96F35|nr:helix-turn-helix domain-containing protein [Corynebacterium sp.]
MAKSSMRADFITRAEAAKKCSVSTKTIDRLVARGELKAVFFTPRATRISVASLDDYIARHTSATVFGGVA